MGDRTYAGMSNRFGLLRDTLGIGKMVSEFSVLLFLWKQTQSHLTYGNNLCLSY